MGGSTGVEVPVSLLGRSQGHSAEGGCKGLSVPRWSSRLSQHAVGSASLQRAGLQSVLQGGASLSLKSTMNILLGLVGQQRLVRGDGDRSSIKDLLLLGRRRQQGLVLRQETLLLLWGWRPWAGPHLDGPSPRVLEGGPLAGTSAREWYPGGLGHPSCCDGWGGRSVEPTAPCWKQREPCWRPSKSRLVEVWWR